MKPSSTCRISYHFLSLAIILLICKHIILQLINQARNLLVKIMLKIIEDVSVFQSLLLIPMSALSSLCSLIFIQLKVSSPFFTQIIVDAYQ